MTLLLLEKRRFETKKKLSSLVFLRLADLNSGWKDWCRCEGRLKFRLRGILGDLLMLSRILALLPQAAVFFFFLHLKVHVLNDRQPDDEENART